MYLLYFFALLHWLTSIRVRHVTLLSFIEFLTLFANIEAKEKIDDKPNDAFCISESKVIAMQTAKVLRSSKFRKNSVWCGWPLIDSIPFSIIFILCCLCLRRMYIDFFEILSILSCIIYQPIYIILWIWICLTCSVDTKWIFMAWVTLV